MGRNFYVKMIFYMSLRKGGGGRAVNTLSLSTSRTGPGLEAGARMLRAGSRCFNLTSLGYKKKISVSGFNDRLLPVRPVCAAPKVCNISELLNKFKIQGNSVTQ